MSVKYKVVAKGNPAKPTDPKKFYATPVSSGEVSYKEVANEVAAMSSLNVGDTYNALTTSSQVMIKELSNGNIVRMGEFGSFQLSLSSDGQDKPEKVNASNIKNAKILFRPGPDFKKMLKALTFEKA